MAKITLAFDTSCDDTSVAVTCGLEIWSNVIASQTELHRPYGGVFPTVAKLAHQENIQKTMEIALKRSLIRLDEIEQIAITIGPGLAPALEVGIKFATQLARQQNIPLVPINHVEAHLLSSHVLQRPKNSWQGLANEKQRATRHSQQYWQALSLPALGLIVSGKHTSFVLLEKPSAKPQSSATELKFENNLDRHPGLKLTSHEQSPWLNSGLFRYTVLGQAIDDAAGECLDKIGRMLNLGYPAGPVIEELAKRGNEKKYALPLPMTESQNFDLSFSGLKTYTRNLIEQKWGQKVMSKQEVHDLSASVQYAIFRHICYKLNKLLRSNKSYNNIRQIWLGGGVAANAKLRQMLRITIDQHNKKNATSATQRKAPVRPLLIPYRKNLCGDNAAMIGIVASYFPTASLHQPSLAPLG